MKTKQISLPKKLKAMKPNTMVGIPKEQIQDALPVINSLPFAIQREYQQGNLIITRTA
jgi:hypothetical protein